MAREDFHTRIARIQEGGGGAGIMLAGEGDSDTGGFGKIAEKAKKASGPSFFKSFLIWLFFLPLGYALSFLTTVFLDPEMTPEAVHYTKMMGIVLGGHLLLAAAAATAIFARLRRKGLNRLVLASFAGYGLASAMLNNFLQ